MRTLCVLLLTTWVGTVRADEAAEARKVLDQAAVSALGGEKELARGAGLRGKSKGTYHTADARVALTNEFSVQGIDRCRWRTESTADGNPITILLVLAGDKGWLSGNGQPAGEFPRGYLPLLKADLAALRLAEEPHLLRGKEFMLSPLGELKIDDRAAVGLKVRRKGAPEMDLFFDKKEGLPLRVELRVKEGPDGEEVGHTIALGGYRKVGGRKVPMQLALKRDGKPTLEMERIEVEVVEAFDEGTFAKP